MEKEIRLSFFKRVKMSVFDFDKYHIIASEGLTRAIIYLVKLIIVFALIVSIATIIKFSQLLDEGVEYLSNNVPNFYFENNSFVLDNAEDVKIENHRYTDFLIILTNSESYSEDEIKDFDGITIVFTKNKLLFKQQNSTSINTQDYEELNNSIDLSQINKEYIVNLAKGESSYTILANIFAVIFISTFLTYFLTAILDTIALSLLGFIVSRLIKMPFKYGALYSLSISAITLSVLLNAIYMVINMFTGFVIPYFQIMYTLVSYVYLIAALLIMKSEIIKKKVQIQVQIMNKKFDPEKLESKEEKKDIDKKEDEENKKKDVGDKKEGKEKKSPDIKNKENPEPQANFKANNN